MPDDIRPTVVDLAELAASLHEERSTQATIESVIEFTTTAVAADFAGVLFVGPKKRIGTMAASDDIVQHVDALQMKLGEGPDLALFDGHHTITVDDTFDEKRWPKWAQAVADQGIRSLVSVRLSTRERVYGSLNAYSLRPEAFAEEDRAVLVALARHAAIAVSSSMKEHHLNAAIDSRKLIGQAQGILMERFSLTDDQAFAVLLRYSQHNNEKLRVVAQRILDERKLD